MKHLNKILGIVIYVLLSITLPNTLYATTEEQPYILTTTTNGIAIYTLNSMGANQLVGQLPGNFSINGYGEAEWMIRNASDLTVSPNGQFIGFTAWRNQIEFALFIYNVTQNNLQQKTVPFFMQLTWSPNSDAIVLQPVLNDNSLVYPNPMPETFLYTLGTTQLTQLTSGTSNVENEFLWIPNSQTLVYIGAGLPCVEPCRAKYDIYLINAVNLNGSPLTNLGTQIPSDVLHSICDLRWSASNQRLYYTVGCAGSPPRLEHLYSVDLAGNNRLEIALPTLYPLTDILDIRDVIPNTLDNSIYISIFSQEGLNNIWRVIRITSNQEIQAVFEAVQDINSPRYLETTALSPNGNFMALAGHIPGEPNSGGFIVVNMTNSQVVRSNSSPLQVICNLEWLDNQNLSYTQHEFGGCSEQDTVQNIWSINIDTGATTNLTVNLVHPIWFITSFVDAGVVCNLVSNNIADLRTAITTANGNGTPDTICLNPTITYSITDAPSGYNADGSNGLPSITSDITLISNGGTATLERASGSPNFRLLRVASGGTLTLNNVIVQGGNASSSGGGIRNLGTLNLINSRVQNNTAAGGAGIYNLNGTVNISASSQITGNTSSSHGGGIYNNGGTLVMTDATISNNTAATASSNGGGIYNSNGNLTVQGSTLISANNARLGGGLYLSDSGSHTVSIDMGVSIMSNSVVNNGGGVYINTGAVTIGNASGGLVTVSSNVATNSGSGIYQAGGNLTLRHCNVSDNGNSSAGSGGGIRSAATLTIADCIFANNRVNTTSGLGAGIYLNSSASVAISNMTIANTPATAAARNGAGMFVSTAATVTITDSTFTGNRAQNIGGGLFVDLGNTATITSTTFSNNSAVSQGGAIANYGTLTLTASHLLNNNGGNYGGALVNDNSTTGDSVSQTCITGNAATNGSAFYSFSATFNAENNWWGSTGGAGSTINANVDAAPSLSSCSSG
jgi:predicted outer membrane repeat protein